MTDDEKAAREEAAETVTRGRLAINALISIGDLFYMWDAAIKWYERERAAKSRCSKCSGELTPQLCCPRERDARAEAKLAKIARIRAILEGCFQ